MRIHPFTPIWPQAETCGVLVDGKLCDDFVDDRQHLRIVEYSKSCWFPVAEVKVYIGRGDGPVGGIHYADLLWQREDDGAWFSGWYRPHNDPSKSHRADALDVWYGREISAYVTRALEDRFTEEELNSFGVKNV